MKFIRKTAQNMSTTSFINPQRNAANVDRQVFYAERLFLIVAVIITSIGFFVWGRSAAAQYTDLPLVQNLVGIGAALASAFVTDFAFRTFLEEVVFQGLAWFHPNVVGRKGSPLYFRFMAVSRWLLLLVVVLALFAADWYSVQAIRDPFASQARQTEKTDLAATTAALSGEMRSASAPMAEQINTLKKDIAAAERRTTAANGALVSLAANGNGWAANELEKKESAATRASRKELDKLQSAYTTTLANQSAILTSTTDRVSAKNAEIEEENRQKKYTLSGMYFMAGGGCKVLTVILRIFLVVSFLAKTPTLDANGDGVVDGRDVTAAARDDSFR